MNRDALWFKLYKKGLNGKILTMFRNMYNIVKSSIKFNNEFSDFVEIAVGLRQGQTNSPTFFSLFIEDIESFLQQDNTTGLTINEICLVILLFADDMVICGDSVEDLQSRLNSLREYCEKWGLEVNTAKTKVVVFRKRGPVKRNEHFIYNDEQLEIVDDFNYLGITLNYTGTFALNIKCLKGKALRAMHTLLNNIKRYNIRPDISLQLFDAFVGSILNYGCPIWGFTKSCELERIHLQFCKTILGVKQSTSNAAIYAELGRYPLYVFRFVHIIKYWVKIINTDSMLLKSVYTHSLAQYYNGRKNWVFHVKKLLDDYGFSSVFVNHENINFKLFVNLFKKTVTDCALQKLFGDIEKNEILKSLYIHLKPSFGISDYLIKINSFKIRNSITRLRVSSHNLFIESLRHGRNRKPRNERLCYFCGNDIEDEFHFIITCKKYSDLRNKFIPKYYVKNPSMYKFIDLLSSKKKKVLLNLGNFIAQAFKRRELNQPNLQT